jgi:hypothetical protein
MFGEAAFRLRFPVPAPTVEGIATVSRLSVTDAVAIQRTGATEPDDSIMRRAEEILDAFGFEPDPEEGPARTAAINQASGRRGEGFSHNPAEVVAWRRRQQLKAQKAELARQQDTIDAQLDPSPWGAYGVHRA